MKPIVLSCSALLSVLATAVAIPTSTSSAATPAGSQIRTDQDPVYHLYLQEIGMSISIYSVKTSLTALTRWKANIGARVKLRLFHDWQHHCLEQPDDWRCAFVLERKHHRDH